MSSKPRKLTLADVQLLVDAAVAKAKAKPTGGQVLRLIRESVTKAEHAKSASSSDQQNIAQFFPAPKPSNGPPEYDRSIVDAIRSEMYRQRKSS